MTQQIGTTWSGCHTFAASQLLAPRTVEELQEVVASSRRVRALGTRHSFNDIADTEGALVSVQSLPERFELDDAAGTVTVSGGSTYARVAAQLGETRWALQNLGSLPHISVAGPAPPARTAPASPTAASRPPWPASRWSAPTGNCATGAGRTVPISVAGCSPSVRSAS